jgi:hypothetical protein
MRWIGTTLVLLSVAALLIGGSWFTATEEAAWSPALQTVGVACFFVWWIPGLVGVVLVFLARYCLDP